MLSYDDICSIAQVAEIGDSVSLFLAAALHDELAKLSRGPNDLSR